MPNIYCSKQMHGSEEIFQSNVQLFCFPAGIGSVWVRSSWRMSSWAGSWHWGLLRPGPGQWWGQDAGRPLPGKEELQWGQGINSSCLGKDRKKGSSTTHVPGSWLSTRCSNSLLDYILELWLGVGQWPPPPAEAALLKHLKHRDPCSVW